MNKSYLNWELDSSEATNGYLKFKVSFYTNGEQYCFKNRTATFENIINTIKQLENVDEIYIDEHGFGKNIIDTFKIAGLNAIGMLPKIK